MNPVEPTPTKQTLSTNHTPTPTRTKRQDGSMRGLAFAKDPDGYWVELVGRGLTI